MWLLGGVGGRGIVCSEFLMQGKEADLHSDLLLFFLSLNLSIRSKLGYGQIKVDYPSVMNFPASWSILEVMP